MPIRRALVLLFVSALIGIILPFAISKSGHAQQQSQRLVESVDIQGNRRLRDEDLLYYVQTRPGDVFSQQQVEKDLQALLSLNFFDKTETRVLTEEGTRGGVNVIFIVKELPIIRDIQFEGLKSVAESDVLKAFRENRIGVSKESIYDPVKARNAIRLIKELLATKGHPNATVDIRDEDVSETSRSITFVVKEGERVRVVDIQFEGNQVFSDGSLRSQMKYVREAGLISRFKGTDILNREKLDQDLRLVTFYMRSKGYLQARTGEPRIEGLGPRRTGLFIPLPFLSSVDEALRITVPVTEGKIYRIGEMKIEGNSIFSEQQIRAVIGLKPGDVANGKRIGDALYEDLRKYYGGQGFIEYTADPTPAFRDNPQNPNEGIVDFTITIDEGKQFTLRRLEFLGNTFTRDKVLRREVLLNEGDIYNQTAFEYSILRLNQLGYFEPIDDKKDADFRTNPEEGLVDVNLKVTERGRQQVSFNGGISGIGGSFFGLEYSTNNLLGRGETLSFQLAAGNRQRSFQFSFTEPYFRDRPITVGFSVYTFSQKFFGEGTGLSQNLNAQVGLFTGDLFNTSEENLFTRNSTGGSIFASAPLSEFYRKRRFTQFSRVGLSYQLSQSSVKDPPINEQGGINSIPIIYRQPNILTSRVTPTFVYDTRNYSKDANDPTSGTRLSAQLALSGLGGDVRTYAPTIEYIHYMPVRRKKSDNPEVFGFRLLAGTVGSFATTDKIKNANSLAFVDGIPIYERFFLGDETSIRGYNVRSIGPLTPVESFITTRNVVAATNPVGAPEVVPGLPEAISQLGIFTGPTGSNSLLLGRTFTAIGGDTQMLANLEYRIPLFGPVSLAAFADIGTAFNMRTGGDQFINSEFLADQPFLFPLSLSTLALAQNRALQPGPNGGLIIEGANLVTRERFAQAICPACPTDPLSGLPVGMQQIFLRGEAQRNTAVRLNQSVFSHFSDYRSSIGMELRFQVPVVNVPFRLIYAYNPNARRGVTDELPGFFFNEQKSVFRFSVGRTF